MIDANRDDRIRTCGPFVPNEVRYQTAPHPGLLTLEDGWSASGHRCSPFKVVD